MRLSQIALSAADGERTTRFYQDLIGLKPAGGSRWFRGPFAARVQGVPKASSTCRWLIDGQEFFQIEIFEFHRPRPRDRPIDWRPCDIGYCRIAVEIDDFDNRLASLDDQGYSPIAEVEEIDGHRRACVYDPDGVVVELVETVAGRASPKILSLAASVDNLTRSVELFSSVLGLSRDPQPVVSRDTVWGLKDSSSKTVRLHGGGPWLEITQYTEPVPKPRPSDYRISDRGILNLALGFRSRREFMAVFRRCKSAGYLHHMRADMGALSAVYVIDPLGFSVELLYCSSYVDSLFGFSPPPRILSRLLP